MIGFQYHTKHFEGFDVVIQENTGKAFIVSEEEPENKPQIGPFRTPAEAIEFGINRVENIK